MAPQHILALDQGTTGSRAMIMDSGGRVVSTVKREFRQIFPKPGWVEHDPEDIWASILTVIKEALLSARIGGKDIAAVGIANQRETTLLWDRQDGKPACRAVVWQDRRAAGVCGRLKKSGHEKTFRERTGLVLDPYFSGVKLRWIFENNSGLKKRAQNGTLAFGTVDSFLLWRLSGGREHATDPSNASRTLLMNLGTLSWDPELVQVLGIPPSLLPDIRPTLGVFGRTKNVPGLPDGIPIAAMAGDQQAALFGQACFEPGEAKCTFGTGSFVLLNTGAKPAPSRSGCLSTVAWRRAGETCYALEGSALVCGAAVQWLRDNLRLIGSSGEIEPLALSVKDNGGVFFVPALTGLGAPHWDPEARGLICGLTRGATRAHLARATLEALAFQNAEILSAMRRDLKKNISRLKVDGGASTNDLLMQLQADFSGIPCVRPKIPETTAAGACFMAGLAVGLWTETKDIRKIWREDRTFSPALSKPARTARTRDWRRAVDRCRARPGSL